MVVAVCCGYWMLRLCSLCLAGTSIRSLSRTTLSCACIPLVSRVCRGNAHPLSTGGVGSSGESQCGSLPSCPRFLRRCYAVHRTMLGIVLHSVQSSLSPLRNKQFIQVSTLKVFSRKGTFLRSIQRSQSLLRFKQMSRDGQQWS